MFSTIPVTTLGVDVDVDRLVAELDALPAAAWRRDPEVPNRSFVALVHRRGDHTDDRLGGVVRPTTWFDTDSYLAEVVASLGVVVGRVRVVRGPADGSDSHRVAHPYWAEHDVVRIPLVSNAEVLTECGDEHSHFPVGTVWRTDGLHVVRFRSAADRSMDPNDVQAFVHLEVVSAGDALPTDGPSGRLEFARVSYTGDEPPGRILTRVARVAALLPDTAAGASARDLIGGFAEQWRSAWLLRHADTTGARSEVARKRLRDEIAVLDGSDELVPRASLTVGELLSGVFVDGAFAPSDQRGPGTGVNADPRFDRPVFVIGTPRSGAALLFDALAGGADVVTVEGGVRSFVARRPDSSMADHSDRIDPEWIAEHHATALRDSVFEALRDRNGAALPMNATGVRLVDADPRNALCIEMLDKVFPDARFVFVVSDPREEIQALIEAWDAPSLGRHVELPGWEGPPWRSVVPPQWADWAGLSTRELAARQWQAVAATALADLDRVAPGRWTAVDQNVLVGRPRRELRRLLRFAGLDVVVDDERVAPLDRHRLVVSGRTLSDEAWAEVEPVVGATAVAAARIADVRPDRRRTVHRPRRVLPGSEPFAELLAAVDASLLVVGRDPGVVVVIGSTGDDLRLDSVDIPGARAVAVPRQREIVVATAADVWRYRRQRDGSHDQSGEPVSLFVQRSSHHIGSIDVHEMVPDSDGELWLVATRFSCLATIDDDHSFVPQWVPGFVSKLAGDDRCHLNGLAVRDGRPRYVTAYSESDLSGGWRDTKTFGGVVVDVESDEVIARGLCMPHSPRWHRGALWVLESGSGTLGRIDPDVGRFESVVTVPGFARGVVFLGRYAIVATSRLRAGVDDGVPLAETDRPVRVALALVDLDEAKIVGVLPMRDRLSEIQDVQAVPRGRIHLAGPGSEHHLHSVVVPPTKWA